MSDELTRALERMRRLGLAKHLDRQQVARDQGEMKVVPHDLEHIVTFHQDCTIQRREFELVNGALQPKGDWLPPEHFKAGDRKVRPAGHWQIRVIAGTADFEKDFIRPEDGARRTGEIED